MEKAAILCFPQGLPGFESEHRFAAIQIPGQQPLVYLQSIATDHLCLLALPVRAIVPDFQLQISPDDREVIETGATRQDHDLLALAIVTSEPDFGISANLAAPLIVNLRNNLAVQALQPHRAADLRFPLALPQ